MLNSLLLLFVLILISAFFSLSEIVLAASRKIKLNQLINEGNKNAQLVLDLQQNSGVFITVVQIGVNAVAILGGIVGDTALSPYLQSFFAKILPVELAGQLAFFCSFLGVTSLFILFADLLPKRIGIITPEPIATRIIKPFRFCLWLFKPLVWFFNGIANFLFQLFHIPTARNDDVTTDDIHAMFEAGAISGALREQEQELIGNVFELDYRTVPSSMTMRENIIYFDIDESESEIKQKISLFPHSKFLVCDNTIDNIVGYVDSKDLLNCLLNNQTLSLTDGVHIHPPLIIPDTLTLSQTLDSFRDSGKDFSVVLNEYALVVGIITLQDVMSTLMGNRISSNQEEQIVARGPNSWLIEGSTPIEDVMRVLDIDKFPNDDNYETIGGFMMYMLRKIPKRTDSVVLEDYNFEVVDIDSYKIDQLLVTRFDSTLSSLPNVEKEQRSDLVDSNKS